MADKSPIEWTEATWNPVVGCDIVSPGCTNCYAMKMAARIEAMGTAPHYAGTTKKVVTRGGEAAGRTGKKKGKAVWTGKVTAAPDHILTQPLRWTRPRRIFVNSMSDLFHDDVPDDLIDRIFAVMALTPQHTYQVLTKRSARMREYLTFDGGFGRWGYIEQQARKLVSVPAGKTLANMGGKGLPNIWLGVSAEDQARADERIPDLLATPAAIRWVSAEPLLGPIDFTSIQRFQGTGGYREFVHALAGSFWTDQTGLPNPDPSWAFPGHPFFEGWRGLDWIVAGGESGPRPMHPDWPRQIRDQCAAAGVPFFFKQWGSWELNAAGHAVLGRSLTGRTPHFVSATFEDGTRMNKVGKRRAGRLLDGIEHNAMPERN